MGWAAVSCLELRRAAREERGRRREEGAREFSEARTPGASRSIFDLRRSPKFLLIDEVRGGALRNPEPNAHVQGKKEDTEEKARRVRARGERRWWRDEARSNEHPGASSPWYPRASQDCVCGVRKGILKPLNCSRDRLDTFPAPRDYLTLRLVRCTCLTQRFMKKKKSVENWSARGNLTRATSARAAPRPKCTAPRMPGKHQQHRPI